MPEVALLILEGNRIRLAGQGLPGGAILRGETPENAVARLVPDAKHPRLLSAHLEGDTLRLIYLAEGSADTPLSEAFALSLDSTADHAVRIALMSSHAISRPRVAAYGVVVEEGRMLLCRLSSFEGSGGKWTLPGGGIEFGESPEEAAIREVREETGLEVRLGALLEVQSEVHPSTTGPLHSIRFVYRAYPIGGTLTVEEEGTTDLVAWHSEVEARLLPCVSLAERGIDLAFASGVA